MLPTAGGDGGGGGTSSTQEGPEELMVSEPSSGTVQALSVKTESAAVQEPPAGASHAQGVQPRWSS